MRFRHNIKIVGYKRRSKVGERLALFLRLSMYHRQQDFSLGIMVGADNFDAVAGRVYGHPKAVEYNRTISDAVATIEEVLQHFEVVEQRWPLAGEVREEFVARFNGISQANAPKTITEAIEAFKNSEGGRRSWTDATYQKFDALLANIKAYDSRATMESITEQWLYGLVQWYVSEGYTNPTIAKKIGFVKWWLRWCEAKEYYKGNAHKVFSVKLKGQNYEQKTIIYLDREELTKLEFYDFSKAPHLDRARDVFIFSCYTGLRYSDIARLEKTQISDTKISLVTQKTDDALTIDLNDHTKRILGKYATLRGIKALPVISNQKANDYIREACKVAGIDTPVKLIQYSGSTKIETQKPKWECMSFHAGRRTFITMALLLEIPIPVIMQWSGHHDVKMLKPYMAVVDELRKREMAKFDKI